MNRKRAAILVLGCVMPFLIIAADNIGGTRSLGQIYSRNEARGDDSSCLIGLKASLKDNERKLDQWTPAHLASPCNSFSASNSLFGIICQNSRVNSIIRNTTNLAGSISPSLANCSSLQMLDLSLNHLSGAIPTSIAIITHLTILNLSENSLTGSIPPTLSHCANLSVIDLHRNQLTGIIPTELGSLIGLQVFDVSDNQLSGPIPISLAKTPSGATRFNESSFQGNKGLFGYPLQIFKTQRHSGNTLFLIIVGIVAVVVPSSFCCVHACYILTTRLGARLGGPGHNDVQITPEFPL